MNTIRDAAEFHASNIFVSLLYFSHTITATVNALDQTFPFVTIPGFEALGAQIRSTTGAEMINWHVRVEQDQLEAWANYTLSNYQKMLDASRNTTLDLRAEGSSVKPSDFIDDEITPRPYIPNFEEGGIILAPNYGLSSLWPAWHVSPPIFHPSFINSDPAPWALKGPISAVSEARRLVFTDTVPVENLANRAIKVEDHENYHASLVDYINADGETAFLHPHSAVMVPIFERLNDPASRLVGTFVVVLPWDRYLVNLLPEGVDGITCVLRNSCGKAWTYELAGNSAYYVGEGDLHDSAYDATEEVIPFRDPASPAAVDLVDGECAYTYHIYATSDFEHRYRSRLPWALTFVVASTFLIMIATFIVYDQFVIKRNKKVVGHATKTNAIVSSLFPQQVKQRLLNKDEQEASKTATFQASTDANETADSDPIADLYPEVRTGFSVSVLCSSTFFCLSLLQCTVFFADIVGFTKVGGALGARDLRMW